MEDKIYYGAFIIQSLIVFISTIFLNYEFLQILGIQKDQEALPVSIQRSQFREQE